MDDFLQRLREPPSPKELQNGIDPETTKIWHDICCEAADEIAELRAEMEQAEADNAALKSIVKRVKQAPRLEDLQRIAELEAQLAGAEEEVTNSKKRIQQLYASHERKDKESAALLELLGEIYAITSYGDALASMRFWCKIAGNPYNIDDTRRRIRAAIDEGGE